MKQRVGALEDLVSKFYSPVLPASVHHQLILLAASSAHSKGQGQVPNNSSRKREFENSE